MAKYENVKKRYYQIPKVGFWIGVCIMLSIIMGLSIYRIDKEDKKVETFRTEHETIESLLEDTEKCYLCGMNDRSLMGYYRKFDTLGVIVLNDWSIVDLRLKEYDSEGNEITEELSYSSSVNGSSQVGSYHVDGNPARGMSRASFEFDEAFDSTVIEENLCQECLDKVIQTLVTYQAKGEKSFAPFVLVDFATLDVYPMQKENIGYSVRDYWVSLQHGDKIKVEAYYVPER